MSDNLIYTRSYSSPQVDRREIFRYAGVREATSEIENLLEECIFEADRVLNYKVCYRVFDISVGESYADLGFAKVSSASLIKTLLGCEKIVLFCATVGIGIDRLISRYSLTLPSKAVIMQALGSERVEALCDVFCKEIKEESRQSGYSCTRRFSPGYADLPLDLQSEIFATLDCTKKVGVSLGDNLFMTPTKSVTAIIGIKM